MNKTALLIRIAHSCISKNYLTSRNGFIVLKRNFCVCQGVKLNRFRNDTFDDEIKRSDLEYKQVNTLTGPSQYDKEFLDKISPSLPVSFNLAAYADASETLQQLIKLGVDLSFVERRIQTAELILKLDFEKDIKPYIRFLHDNGVSADHLGYFFTLNPNIFQVHLDDLQVRIDYLKSKGFSTKAIAEIISFSPRFLNIPTVKLDAKLGALQNEFELSGHEVRIIVTRYSKIVSCHQNRYKEMKFCLLEECGFAINEIKELLLAKPNIIMEERRFLIPTFDLLHNEMKIPHELIVKFPETLSLYARHIKPKHLYLQKLKRDQYDPMKPGYVPLSAFCLPDDEFCDKIAKTCVQDLNAFLKSL